MDASDYVLLSSKILVLLMWVLEEEDDILGICGKYYWAHAVAIGFEKGTKERFWRLYNAYSKAFHLQS
ncbi:hypothetical protein Ccrd_024970, partial [Cynara cardunculus var. scolymus]